MQRMQSRGRVSRSPQHRRCERGWIKLTRKQVAALHLAALKVEGLPTRIGIVVGERAVGSNTLDAYAEQLSAALELVKQVRRDAEGVGS